MKITRRLGDARCVCAADATGDIFETDGDQLAIIGKVATPEVLQALAERGVAVGDHQVVVLGPQAIEQLHRAGYSTSGLPFVEV